jgi:antitoxin component of MazEF toxin-antitoxin module
MPRTTFIRDKTPRHVKRSDALHNSDSIVTLREFRGELTMAIPATYISANRLAEGAQLTMRIVGETIELSPAKLARNRVSLAERLTNTDFARVQGWNDEAPVGTEGTF